MRETVRERNSSEEKKERKKKKKKKFRNPTKSQNKKKKKKKTKKEKEKEKVMMMIIGCCLQAFLFPISPTTVTGLQMKMVIRRICFLFQFLFETLFSVHRF
ncbi:hypothetical protein F8388_024133 [Cannabis sativa]|uniref:Uncharacterized protein n=1 Tax=Cannabis sativa TaxID=3483 RepID=A0A7J6FXK4_CANSA|nr:hypothetical protein F8388_024133 [Cannabis sativa]